MEPPATTIQSHTVVLTRTWTTSTVQHQSKNVLHVKMDCTNRPTSTLSSIASRRRQ